MLEQTILNMKVHLKFYARNRLLLVIGLIFLAMTGLSVLPAVYMASSNKNFTILISLFSELNGFSLVFTAGLGLFLVSSHLKNRNIKMVLTKPCLPETWLLSGFLSAAFVSLMLYLSIFVFAFIFSLAAGISFQPGFLFISIETFMRAVLLLSYIVFLTMVMHPVLAVMTAVIFNEGSLYQLKMMVTAIGSSFSQSWPMKLLNGLIEVLYMAMPMTQPVSENHSKISATMRVSGQDWAGLIMTAGYTAATAGLFFLLSDYFLRRKKLI